MTIKISPFISVVIPTYNHADFLRVAISSVLQQTYQNFEILIIDNNSTDNTFEVIENFNDDRIRLFSINNEGIIAASRNFGVDQSKGEWIAYLDSDDLWYSTRLATLVKNIEKNSQYDVLSTDEYKNNCHTGKKSKLFYGPLKRQKYKSLLLYGNRLSPSATLVRKDFLLKHKVRFNERRDFITVEDFDYWLQLAFFDACFKFIHNIEGEYLVHGGNSSSYLFLHRQNELNLLKYHVFNVQNFETDKKALWVNMQSIISIREAYHQLKVGKLILFIKTLFESLGDSPYFVMKWAFHKLTFILISTFTFFRY